MSKRVDSQNQIQQPEQVAAQLPFALVCLAVVSQVFQDLSDWLTRRECAFEHGVDIHTGQYSGNVEVRV